ncbi:MAG: CPBP family intramembrane glutamic endopeptidase [Pseudomonadota bacterium]
MRFSPTASIPDLQDFGPGPTEAHRAWTAIPAYLLIAMLVVAIGFALAGGFAILWQWRDAGDHTLSLALSLIFCFATLGPLSIASRLKTGNWALSIGPRLSRLAALQALGAGLLLACLSMAVSSVVFALISLVNPEVGVGWFLDGFDDIPIPQADETVEIGSMVVLQACLLTLFPVVDELFFRGYLLHRLIVKRGVVGAMIIVSIIYSMLDHYLLSSFLVGMVLAFATLHTGSLWWGILARASYNAFFVIWYYADHVYSFSEPSPLDNLYTSPWFGIAFASASIPLVYWVWQNRHGIKLREWAAPIIESAADGVQGFARPSFGRLRTGMIVLCLVSVSLLSHWAMHFGFNGTKYAMIDPADIDRYATTGFGDLPEASSLAATLCSLDHFSPADAFLSQLEHAVGDVLTFPIPTFTVGTRGENLGEFVHRGWSIGLNPDHLESREKSKRQLADFYNTVAHELRHAEQVYAAATYHASTVSHPDLMLIPVYYPYFYLPHRVRYQASHNASVEGSEGFEFGRLVSAIDNNDHLEDRRDHLNTMMDRHRGTDEYDRYHFRYRYELPLERDAYAFGDTVEKLVNGCLPPSLEFRASARDER